MKATIGSWTVVTEEHVYWSLYVTPNGNEALAQFRSQNSAEIVEQDGKLLCATDTSTILEIDDVAKVVYVKQRGQL